MFGVVKNKLQVKDDEKKAFFRQLNLVASSSSDDDASEAEPDQSLLNWVPYKPISAGLQKFFTLYQIRNHGR